MKLTDLVTNPKKLKTYGKYISPEEAYERIQAGDKDPMLVDAVASDAKYAYLYARYIIKGRFPKGEKAIASDPEYAYWYAFYVIKDRFPEGEKVIASSPFYAYWYARDVINDRWPEGEKVIASDPDYASKYKDFLRGLK